MSQLTLEKVQQILRNVVQANMVPVDTYYQMLDILEKQNGKLINKQTLQEVLELPHVLSSLVKGRFACYSVLLVNPPRPTTSWAGEVETVGHIVLWNEPYGVPIINTELIKKYNENQILVYEEQNKKRQEFLQDEEKQRRVAEIYLELIPLYLQLDDEIGDFPDFDAIWQVLAFPSMWDFYS